MSPSGEVVDCQNASKLLIHTRPSAIAPAQSVKLKSQADRSLDRKIGWIIFALSCYADKIQVKDEPMALLLKTTKFIESQIDAFLDIVGDSATLFHMGMEDYLCERYSQFEERLARVRENEQKADDLRVSIERYLYERTLIPENRGDVLAILENTDEVIDNIKDAMLQFSIEMPDIPSELDDLWTQTSKASVQAVEQLTFAVRSFFRDLPAVNNYIHKVYFFEREADHLGEKLRRLIFSLEIELSHKSQLRFFAMHIEKISDYAQAVCDRLAIYTIKRQL